MVTILNYKKNRKNQILASFLAFIFMCSGTFAWRSFSQVSTNEIIRKVDTPGARLHDYFDGENKDVFIENYATGEYAPEVYARIRLSEYFEYGDGAGTDAIVNPTVLRGDIQNDSTPNINDINTWDIYNYKGNVSVNDSQENIRSYRSLVLGGDTIYLPTFNHNNTDLEAEVNGSFLGENGNGWIDKSVRYNDYVEYTSGSSIEGLVVTEENPSGTSTYHQADSTASASVMTMHEWIDNGQPIGDIWVFDSTGWAYYAKPIQSGKTSGLLLDKISVDANPKEEWYYAIEVTAQLATFGDWGEEETSISKATGMYSEMTTESMDLLTRISINQQVDEEVLKEINLKSSIYNGDERVEFSGTTVHTGDVIYFTADIKGESSQEVIWDLSGNTSDKTTLTNGVLTIGALEVADTELTIKATSIDNIALFTEINLTVLATEQTVSVIALTRTDDIIQDNAGNVYPMVYAGDIVELQVTTNGLPTTDVTWEMGGHNSSTTLSNGIVSIGNDENTIKYITIKASSVDNPTISCTIYLVTYPQSITVNSETQISGVGNTVEFSVETFGLPTDNVTWTILGGVSSGGISTISSDGVLTVGNDELPSSTLTIVATSVDNNTVYGEGTLTIVDKGIILSGKTTADAGEEIQFTAKTVGLSNDSLIWEVQGNTSSNTSITNDGLLTISGNELGENILTILVESIEDSSVSNTINIETNKQSIVIINAKDGTTCPGDSFRLEYEIEGFADESVYYFSSNSYDFELEIEGDVFSVPIDTPKGSMSLAIVMSQSNTSIYNASLLFVDGWHLYAGTGYEFEIDGLNWQVAGNRWEEQQSIDGDDVILFYLANPTEERAFSNNGGMWDTSEVRSYLNSDGVEGFLNDKNDILSMAIPYETSRNGLEGNGQQAFNSTDKVFLLSTTEIDLFNIIPNGLKVSNAYMWTRDCYGSDWSNSGSNPIVKVNYLLDNEKYSPSAMWSNDSSEEYLVVPAFYVVDNYVEF